MSRACEYFLANFLWLASGCLRTSAFHKALRNPRAAQRARLFSLLKRNAGCDYGRRHQFERLHTIQDYQTAVPLITYDSLENEIAAIKLGRQGVLTEEPVISMEKTTGSTGASKYIPCTSSLKHEFQAAVAPWMANLYSQRAKMIFGGSYWSITPLAAEREVTEGGLPVGCADERDYFGTFQRALLERLILTPRELARVLDVDSSRYITLRFLLEAPHLSFISVWNPSFLTLLIRFLWENSERLIADVRHGTLTPSVKLPTQLEQALARRLSPRPKRALELEEMLRRHRQLPLSDVWPKLSVISCWASANARNFLLELQSLFSGVKIQPKGLLATEGVVSIPLLGHEGGALALTSHFFEFIPKTSSAAQPLLADEIKEGETYRVILTTGGGLYRYSLADLVQVVGKVEETPLIEFVGKEESLSDLCGEKLHAARVEAVLDTVFSKFQLAPLFAMIAPEWGRPPQYTLFIESPELPQPLLDRLVESIEAALAEGHHYSYCRRLGQLGPLRSLRVRDGARRYLDRCMALGQRLGSIKPTGLHCKAGWSEWFQAGAEKRKSQGESLRI